MPLYRCKNPICTTYVKQRGYCDKHLQKGNASDAEQKARYHKAYDVNKRDKSMAKFYHSSGWEIARKYRLIRYPVCERCGNEWAREVHHTIPAKQLSAKERLEQRFLMAVCQSCHRYLEGELDHNAAHS